MSIRYHKAVGPVLARTSCISQKILYNHQSFRLEKDSKLLKVDH